MTNKSPIGYKRDMEIWYETFLYESANGKCPFIDSIEDLRDVKAAVNQMEAGNFSDCKPVGSGVFESRIHYGPGYRIYYSLRGKKVILLYLAGTKKPQQEDIEKAQAYKRDFEAQQWK